MTDRVLNLGIAGLGVASTLVLPGVEKFPRARIAGAADIRPAAQDAFRRKYDAPAYASVAELCADPNVDVVWIATPNQLHHEHAIMAAERGKHVICTKPMALTVQECERMCDAAERNKVKLLCGQTYSMSPDVQAMWKAGASGDLGRLTAITTWMSADWMLKPRVGEEVDEALGGGVVFRQAPHLIDTVRLLGGGMVRSVRASVGRWMSERPCAGNFVAYLEFADGTPATITYSGYGYFDTSELTWGIGGRMFSDEERIKIRAAMRRGELDDEADKEAMRFGGSAPAGPAAESAKASAIGTRAHIRWFGLTVASYERGDIRQSPNGVYVYGDEGRREIPVHGGRGVGLIEMSEMYDAVTRNTPIVHDGRWATATLEVSEAILQSAHERREIMLTRQCGLPS